MTPIKRVLVAGLLAALATSSLSACSSPKVESGKIQIVASTSTWADVATQIGGDVVEVVALIDDVNKDPHSFEASARDQLAVNNADIVIANGGGYDDFVNKLTDASSDPEKLFDACTEQSATSCSSNEHLWFNIYSVVQVAEALTARLIEIDAENETTYAANSDAFSTKMNALGEELIDTFHVVQGMSAFTTEPLADLLLANLGFDNKTPAEFAEAIENETDVPAQVMQQSLELINQQKVDYLVINSQTTNAQVDQLIEAARNAGVRAVVLSELLPDGEDYFSWMSANLKTLNPGK
jgi:zinc/manganese transport system substrate-binding protein